MATIVDLNALIPEDVVIRYGRPPKDYAIPGDISTETVFRLFDMYEKLKVVEGDDAITGLKAGLRELEAELLELFRVRDPKLQTLPFGLTGLGHVIRTVLGQLGLQVTENPTPPKPKTRTTSRKR
jgi:hypothetical protein